MATVVRIQNETIMDACREQGVEDPTWRWVGALYRPVRHLLNKALISNQFQTSTLPVLYQYPTSTPPVLYQLKR